MSKLSVAICDENQSYGEKISAWLFLEQSREFSGGFFSSIERFQEQYSKQKFQIVLLGSAFLKEMWIQEKIKQEKEVLWIHLWEEGEENMPEINEQIPIVEKYQPMPALVRSIFQYYGEYGTEDVSVLGTTTEILGWYAPAKSIWQTPLALTMAALLAEKEKVLYVNLWECSGLEHWFQEEYENDLLDVMYFCRDLGQKTSTELGKFVYSVENLDYLPPVRDGSLLCELEEQDYIELVEMLSSKTAYDIVLLDMGSMFPGVFDIWKQCQKIYVPQEQNVLARGIGRSFEEMIKRQADLELEEKISWLSLPEWKNEILMPGNLMQQWLWGGQGDYVRELLGKRN